MRLKILRKRLEPNSNFNVWKNGSTSENSFTVHQNKSVTHLFKVKRYLLDQKILQQRLIHSWASKVTAWCSPDIVTKVDDIMMKRVSRQLPSLISSIIDCLYYGFFSCHDYFGSHSEDLLITFYVKLKTHTRVWEWNSPILFFAKSTLFFFRKVKIRIHND